MDPIIQIEIALNYLNDLFAKSVAFKDGEIIKELNALRHQIYYGDFEYENTKAELNKLDKELKKYE